MIVQTASGKLRGSQEREAYVFKGIPFAAPPVGPRRFKAPQKPDSWDGVRDATEFGPVCPQNPSPLANLFARAEMPMDEDCLTLNIWTPVLGSEEKRPVMVWIHGGGFTGGSGRVPWYHGHAFARDGVVCVTINYRLGPLGFVAFPGVADPNCGLLDQIAALDWVRENIAAFGGDPDNVTIFGESAGGMSVGTLMGSPRASGLFHKAIPQSGAAHTVFDADTAQRIAVRLTEALGADPRDLSAQQLLEGLTVLQRPPGDVFGDGFDGLAMACQPVVDGDVVPRVPIESIAGGSAKGVATLAGSTLEEWKLFTAMTTAERAARSKRSDMAPQTGGVRIPRPLRNRAAKAGRSVDEIVGGYERPDRSELDVLNAIETDRVFRIPAIRLAEAQSANATPAYMYLFSWRTPAFDGRLGSCHALEIPFVFDTLDAPGSAMFVGPNPPQALADAMHAAWVAFAKSADPGWAVYDTATRPTMVLDVESRVQDDPAAGERKLWEGVL